MIVLNPLAKLTEKLFNSRQLMSYFVFDIGGTNIRLGYSEDGESIVRQKMIPTNKDFNQAIEEIYAASQELSNGAMIEAVGGGVKSLDKTKSHLITHPFFPLWENEPLKQTLEEKFKSPVFLENDAAIVGLGEAVFGAGKDHKIVVYHTVSTGFGGARYVDKKLDQSAFGFEPGGQIIDADGSLLQKNTPVYLEEFIAGVGLSQRFNKKPEEIDDPKVWEEVEKVLAMALNNTLSYWSPEIIILGGSIMKKISIDKVRTHFKEVVKVSPETPEVVEDMLGDEAGLLGALSFLKSQS